VHPGTEWVHLYVEEYTHALVDVRPGDVIGVRTRLAFDVPTGMVPNEVWLRCVVESSDSPAPDPVQAPLRVEATCDADADGIVVPRMVVTNCGFEPRSIIWMPSTLRVEVSGERVKRAVGPERSASEVGATRSGGRTCEGSCPDELDRVPPRTLTLFGDESWSCTVDAGRRIQADPGKELSIVARMGPGVASDGLVAERRLPCTVGITTAAVRCPVPGLLMWHQIDDARDAKRVRNDVEVVPKKRARKR
jgi:hypothetical protein